jgi:hypothetical protein
VLVCELGELGLLGHIPQEILPHFLAAFLIEIWVVDGEMDTAYRNPGKLFITQGPMRYTDS